MFKIFQSNVKGTIKVSTSKNAALPILVASKLLNKQINLNLPNIKDVNILLNILNNLKDENIPSEASKIRASILVIPLLLRKTGKAIFSNVGGCNIGKRPLDTFDDGLKQAGIEIIEGEKKIYLKKRKPNKLIILNEFSVTTTEGLLIYLSFENVDYEIKIYQAAIEPHVIDLINFLNSIGANIKIDYNHKIIIKPSKNIKYIEKYDIIPDYIEAGTFLTIGALCGEIIIENSPLEDLISTIKILKNIGVNIKIKNDIIIVNNKNIKNYKATKIQSMIFPGFPTDLQPIIGTLLTQCEGISKIHEPLFENRLSYLNQLENMGAKIEILNPHQAIIIGKTNLKGTYLTTTDLRAGGSFLVAALIAQGTSYITNEDIILRGYENIVDKLKGIGANIEVI